MQPWNLVIHVGYLVIFFILARIIRKSIPGFTKLRIPDAILAGLMALGAKYAINPLAEVTSGVLALPQMNTDTLAGIVYHLLAIGFISLSLKRDDRKGRGRTAISAGFYNVISYCIQGVVGLGATLILTKTFFPDLFPGFGFLLPFGFAQGPMAGTMAGEWFDTLAKSGLLPFPDRVTALSVGFSFSTIGFLWACFVGVPLMNLLVRRRRRRKEPEPGFAPPPPVPEIEKTREGKPDIEGHFVDRITTQIVLIAGCYLLTYLILRTFDWSIHALLAPASGEGGMVDTVVGIFWGIQFVFGAVIATFVGKIVHKLEDRKVIKFPVTDNKLLQHVGGTAIDFMIAASIAAIDLSVLQAYIVPILVITTAGGLVTIFYTWFTVRKVWPKTYVEHFVGFFGDHTGTVATGLALLRGVDPHFQTSAASDLVYGSAIALPLAFPLILMAGLPLEGFRTGNPKLYLIALALPAGYAALIFLIWFIRPVFRYLTKFSQEK
ncbi:hypothetical protein GF359_03830 [candidate division WOR-3 bacterium]|uniref:Sodium:glutamate symporter n=1 Tax=candidate division WOR-3 bacterium TaxID=2052148 RepID=A0A9D5KAM6_UNCW3|nr:hypothetical protein [candidate division WOR-3 bacterium]MBD3364326.1 hypothetical protein [candidate division WOR-3 bacterium]